MPMFDLPNEWDCLLCEQWNPYTNCCDAEEPCYEIKDEDAD